MNRSLALLATTLTLLASTTAESSPLWSLEPITEPTPPNVSNTSWPTRELDHFILQKIETAKQRPTQQADRRTLARRAYLDLHGLPPTTEELDAYILDNRPNAWELLIDKLLASPRYGERWGRHWLDVARYSDANGMDEDIAYPNAFRYRDYVIDSFNNDKPFDQFIIEQLAGDLLPHSDTDQQREQTIAAGFLSIGPKMLACDDPEKMRRDIVDEQIDTTGRAFLGLTLGCARCHDHKQDPITTEDYYALAGIFMSTKTLTKYSVVAEFHEHDLSPLLVQAKHEQIAALEKNKNHITKREIARLQKNLEPKFKVMSVTEYPTEDVAVHLGGDHTRLGEIIPRRLPAALASNDQPQLPQDQSGRVELANWIASADNPLTARVIANRVWHWHFGRGLVTTPDNFGALGAKPSHPELLDHLAVRLIENHWSLKSLHREIMMSATYRQSSLVTPSLKDIDPDNQLFARWLPRRAESEVIRDSILQKSGRLDLSSRGPALDVRPNKYVSRKKLPEHANHPCRTIYLPVLRSSGYDGQNTFDFPDPATICGRRRTSTVTPQALFLMNSPLVHTSSDQLAKQLLIIPEEQRAAHTIRHLLGRQATPEEIQRAESFVKNYPAGENSAAWAALARVLFATNEFLYIE